MSFVFYMTNTIGYFWNQMIYGKFSSKFNEYCQRKDIPTPYKLCFAEDPIDHVHEALSIDPKHALFQSSIEIVFEKLKFGISDKKIIKIYGIPSSFSIQKIADKDLASYCYKKIYRGQKTKCIFFVYDHLFFMGQYIFSDYSTAFAKEIASNYLLKYNVSDDIQGANFYVEDNWQHRFLYQDTGFSINCKFIDLNNQSLIKPLNEYYNPDLPELEKKTDYSPINRK